MIEKTKYYNSENIIEYIKPQIIDYEKFKISKLKDNVEIKCYYCGKFQSVRKKILINIFLKNFNKNNIMYRKYCSCNCYQLSKGFILKAKKQCLYCGKEFVGDKHKKYCNHTCAAISINKTRILNEEVIKKIKKRSKEVYYKTLYNPSFRHRDENGLFTLTCKVCKIQFKHKKTYRKTCSEKCYGIDNKINGKKGWNVYYNSLHRKSGRSYNEKYFYELIKQKYVDAINNKRMFNGWDADVIIPSLKLAIHWNGIWHYKPVINETHFNKIINNDKLRYKSIEECGYTNYIIEDMKSCKDYNFVEKKYNEFLKKLSEPQPQHFVSIV